MAPRPTAVPHLPTAGPHTEQSPLSPLLMWHQLLPALPKDTEPGFEAMHREDRKTAPEIVPEAAPAQALERQTRAWEQHKCAWFQVWPRWQVGQHTFVTPAEGPTVLATVSSQALETRVFRQKPWTCATCDITSCTEASAGLFLS